jgi:hypothetical protein
LIAEERPVVEREQSRGQYSALEYILAKIITELPLDSFFAAVFTTVLKKVSGLRIAWKSVTATFSLLTTAGASVRVKIQFNSLIFRPTMLTFFLFNRPTVGTRFGMLDLEC